MRKYFSATRTLEWIGMLIPLTYLLFKFDVRILILLLVGIVDVVIATVIYCREKDVVDERNSEAVSKGRSIGFSFMTITALLLSMMNSPIFGSPIIKLETGVALLAVWAVGSLTRTIFEFVYRYKV